LTPEHVKRLPGRRRKDAHEKKRTNKQRRQMHNDSAMRSRARLNKALEELWAAIPNQEKNLKPEGGVVNRVSRAVIVEVAIKYLRKLQAQSLLSQGNIISPHDDYSFA
jgi:hypothetical protein